MSAQSNVLVESDFGPNEGSDIGGLMRFWRLLVVSIFVIGLMASCSDKKEEAARLEEELKQLESAEGVGDTATVEDTMAPAEADASAVPEEEAPAVEPMPPAPQGDGYTLQVASCEDPDYARYLVGVYADRGYEAFVTTITFNDQTYYRVRVGSMQSLSEATNLKAEIEDKYSTTGWVDRLSQ